MADTDIKGPEDYLKYFHSTIGGKIMLDEKDQPIPISDPKPKKEGKTAWPLDIWNSKVLRSKMTSNDSPKKT